MCVVTIMADRRPSNTEPEVVKEKPATSGPVIAGILRSGRKRLGQLADFESSVEPTAGSPETDLLGNQLVGTADPLESELPAQPDRPASICDEIENNQIAGSSNTSQQIQQVQSDLRCNSARSESEGSSGNCSEKDISEFLNSIRESVTMGDKEKEKEPDKEKEVNPEVQIVEDSPTVFNRDKLPKTVKSNQFISVITNAHTLRTKILKYKKNIDRIIAQIKVVEQNGETGSDREDFLDELFAEVQKENKNLKERMKEHEELTSQVRTMAGYIERSNAESTQQMAIKAKTEATIALAEADKQEEDLEEIIAEWSTSNLKFLAGRKRK